MTHAVAAHLTSPADGHALPDLVIVRSRMLEVYTPRHVHTATQHPTKNQTGRSLTWAYPPPASTSSTADRCGASPKASPYSRRQPCSAMQCYSPFGMHTGHVCMVTQDVLSTCFQPIRNTQVPSIYQLSAEQCHRDAKLSVLAWDAARATLVATSLHYFEGDPALKAGRRLFPMAPKAVTDPLGRAAAMLMFRHQLAVLPAVGANVLDMLVRRAVCVCGCGDMSAQQEADEEGDAERSTAKHTVAAVGNSYVINVAKQQIKDVRTACNVQHRTATCCSGHVACLQHVLSFFFAPSYRSVTSSFCMATTSPHCCCCMKLNQPGLLGTAPFGQHGQQWSTWSTHGQHGQHMVNTVNDGQHAHVTLSLRYPHTKDACCLTAISLSLRSKAHPRLWSAQGLPSDAHKLVAVPAGGALVICLNHILYYKQVRASTLGVVAE